MSRQARAAWLLGAVLLAATAVPLGAQVVPAARPKPAPPEAAKTAYRNAVYEAQNVANTRARQQLEAALRADPQFGMAQVLQAIMMTGPAAAEREARIDQSFGALGGSSPADILLALYWREGAAGRAEAAFPILKLATELVPTDPELNYFYAAAQWSTLGTPQAVVAAQRAFRDRFPNHAATYNNLAYTLWQAGDPQGALEAIQHYVQLAPNHPNSHDSYADILILLGRPQEAIPELQRALELEPAWSPADYKLGAIALMLGDPKKADTHFDRIVARLTTPGSGLEARYWQAVTHLYAKDGRGAGQHIDSIAAIAKNANLPGPAVLAHLRAAVVHAYLGKREEVQPHLAAAEALTPVPALRSSSIQFHNAVVRARLGQPDSARAAATRLAALVPADNTALLEAMLALDRKDYPAAEAALEKSTGVSLLERALRAELPLRTGKKAEGEALRKAVPAGSLKQ
ncbi:MAG: hypothetical protein FIB01_06855, partial [Gemmatimonadetes bacterium]|nr:hypothetical protein [Gemmatimonadota bacterium]